MRFHQIKEVVRWAADYHTSLADAYVECATGKVDERVRMALDYLAEHEARMQAELARYLSESDEHRAVLDTWFDDPVDIPPAPVREHLLGDLSSESVQSLFGTALAAHRTLQDLYAHRAEHAVSSAEREFFMALTSELESEIRRLCRDMQRLEDY